MAYEVRTEVVGERGSAMIGLDQNLQVKTTDGRWGGQITPSFVERFGAAYDIELQRWVDAAKAGTIDGPGAWDGYAAVAVCEAGVQALRSGQKVAVQPRRRRLGRSRSSAEEPQAGHHRARSGRSLAVKLALDPQMFFSTSSVYELPDIVARLGYDWMELSPKADFIPFFKYPRVDDAGVKKLKKVAADAGVGIASVLPVLRWSGPDEDQRQAAVRSWKRVIQITVDLGVEVINSEFNGRPEAPETAEAQFLKSMDELLPIFEREGLQLIIEPHPDDFIEDGLEAVNMIRGLNKDWIGFLYCTPHAFHQGHDPATIIEAAGEKVRYVHLADAWNHLTSNGLRYISNPPGNTSPGAPAHGDGHGRGGLRRGVRRAGRGRVRRRDQQLCIRLGRRRARRVRAPA